MSVPADLRLDVLYRDRFACHYCGYKGDAYDLHVDHKIPKAKGGHGRNRERNRRKDPAVILRRVGPRRRPRGRRALDH
jgi:hypothetical protein